MPVVVVRAIHGALRTRRKKLNSEIKACMDGQNEPVRQFFFQILFLFTPAMHAGGLTVSKSALTPANPLDVFFPRFVAGERKMIARGTTRRAQGEEEEDQFHFRSRSDCGNARFFQLP